MGKGAFERNGGLRTYDVYLSVSSMSVMQGLGRTAQKRNQKRSSDLPAKRVDSMVSDLYVLMSSFTVHIS
jgi:hypothetical protein